MIQPQPKKNQKNYIFQVSHLSFRLAAAAISLTPCVNIINDTIAYTRYVEIVNWKAFEAYK